MTLNILINRRTVDLDEAVQYATTPTYTEGQLEKLRETIELQGKLIARLLSVQFGEYEDHFTETQYEPKTTAEKLSFVLGDDVMVTE